MRMSAYAVTAACIGIAAFGVSVVAAPRVDMSFTPAGAVPVAGKAKDRTADQPVVSAIIGRAVETDAGEKVGAVEDLVLAKDGRIASVVIATGPLGVGRRVALPMAALRQKAPDGPFVVNMAKDKIYALPDFKGGRADDGKKHNYYRESARSKVEEWQGKVDSWTAQTKAKADPKAAEASKAVDSAWARVRQNFAALSEAKDEGWDAAKRRFEDAWVEFEKTWDRATKA